MNSINRNCIYLTRKQYKMKYSDFISLQDYFHPVFNLKDEASGIGKSLYLQGSLMNCSRKQ